MPIGYAISDVTICDDIRFEQLTKHSMMGIYDGAMVGEAFPFWLSTFGIRVGLRRIDKLKFDSVICYVIAPDRTEIGRLQLPYLFGILKIKQAVYLRFSGMKLPSTGEYEIHFGMDEPPELVYSFTVFTPAQVAALKE